jgi:4-amino-4-deoxy-L-arabinose transferase-like glycosyltransferase
LEQGRTSLRETAVAAASTVLALLPFLGKAFTIDDPVFLWTARRIAEHPLDPYGFSVHWYERSLPMWLVNKNPPLASYFLALAGRILGWSEPALHLSFLVPAAAAIAGTYRLARRVSPRPLLAAMATLAAPVFLVSSTNVMSDTPLLAFWVWALLLWIEGLDRDSAGRLLAASFLAAAAALTKYFGMSLIPLMALYALLRRSRRALWLPPLLVPLAVLAGYHAWTRQLYGRGLLLDSAAYAAGLGAFFRSHGYAAGTRFLSGLVFTGGCALPALLLAPFLWSRRALLALAAAALAIGLAYPAGWRSGPLAEYAAGWSALVWVHAGLFAAGGISVLALCADDLRARRDPDSVLLALWVSGTFLFAAVVNWDVTGRSILPLAPAAAILLARRLGPSAGSGPGPEWKAWGPVALAGAIALLVARGDASFAGTQRTGAIAIRRMADAEGVATVWYSGHWGFQYYMDAAGGRPLEIGLSPLKPGDWVAIPVNNTNRIDFPGEMLAGTRTVSVGNDALAATMVRADGAGFYASIFGPLPFRLGPVTPDRFIVHRIGSAAEIPDVRPREGNR